MSLSSPTLHCSQYWPPLSASDAGHLSMMKNFSALAESGDAGGGDGGDLVADCRRGRRGRPGGSSGRVGAEGELVDCCPVEWRGQ